jgi:predicted nucleic acid-binding protein
LQDLAVRVETLLPVDLSPDPYDNYLLALAAGGHADYLVTGDKTGVLAFDPYAGTKIVTVRDFLHLTRLLP